MQAITANASQREIRVEKALMIAVVRTEQGSFDSASALRSDASLRMIEV
jgi:hypothetical protein